MYCTWTNWRGSKWVQKQREERKYEDREETMMRQALKNLLIHPSKMNAT
jgi:hypothetical protein